MHYIRAYTCTIYILIFTLNLKLKKFNLKEFKTFKFKT